MSLFITRTGACRLVVGDPKAALINLASVKVVRTGTNRIGLAQQVINGRARTPTFWFVGSYFAAHLGQMWWKRVCVLVIPTLCDLDIIIDLQSRGLTAPPIEKRLIPGKRARSSNSSYEAAPVPMGSQLSPIHSLRILRILEYTCLSLYVSQPQTDKLMPYVL